MDDVILVSPPLCGPDRASPHLGRLVPRPMVYVNAAQKTADWTRRWHQLGAPLCASPLFSHLVGDEATRALIP